MSKKSPFTRVEVVEERHPNQPESVPLVRTNRVLINGKEVRVAKDGIWIDYDHNLETSNELPGGVVAVTVELLVDEFSIRQVPNGYTEGKTSTSTGPHLHFSGHVHGISVEEFAERLKERSRRRKLIDDFNNDDAGVACVVHKRHGKGQPGSQWVTMTVDDLIALITGQPRELP